MVVAETIERTEGYLSNNALREGFNKTVEITDTKKDSKTVAKFFQTKKNW